MVSGFLIAAVTILEIGCGFNPPNFSPALSKQNSGIGFSTNLPPTYLIYDGDPSETFLGAQKNIRMNSISSMDFHFKNEYFHFSPSLYFLGLGLGAGVYYKDWTALSVNSGISIAPVSRSYGFQVNQKIFARTYFTYGLNRADFNEVECNVICSERQGKIPSTYHHFSLGSFFVEKVFLEFRIDYSSGKIDDYSRGISITLYHEFKRGKPPVPQGP